MRRSGLAWLIIAVCAGWLGAPARSVAAEAVDLELILAVDVSRSIDAYEFSLQRQGYANAFRDPNVLEAIARGRRGKIGVALIEWSGAAEQKLVVDWMRIANAEDAVGFAQELENEPRSFAGRTSISGGIDFAMPLFGKVFRGDRRVIDVSGDGVNNSGRPAPEARDAAIALDVVINGLAIINDRPNPIPSWRGEPEPPLDLFYIENVIGGPGAFLMVANDFGDFGRALVAKLLREIADADGPVRILASR
jgi:hypothetical protein